MIRLKTDSTTFGDSVIHFDILRSKPTATHQPWNPVSRFVIFDHARRAIGINQVIERSIDPNG
jgi:hypothetical protein